MCRVREEQVHSERGVEAKEREEDWVGLGFARFDGHVERQPGTVGFTRFATPAIEEAFF